MTTDRAEKPISFEDEKLIRDGEAAVDLYNKDIRSARTRIMPMARGLLAARRRHPSNQDFGDWLQTSSYREIEADDRAALIKLGEHEGFAEKFVRTTSLISPRTIWDAIRDLMPLSHDAKTTPEPESTPEPEPEPAVETETEETVVTKQEVSTPEQPHAPGPYPAPKESKIYELYGKEIGTVLCQYFQHARKPKLFMRLLEIKGESGKKHAKHKINYLAKRCTMPDYPEKLRADAEVWSSRLLYPHLPQKLLDMKPSTLSGLHKYHTALVETERLFVLTPEFGVTDPPMIAFNKAHSIYQSIIHRSNGDGDRSAHVHTPTFAPDDGKPPVVVRGTQLWPAVSDAGYCYDDLRCAYGMADDVLTAFVGPADASMATKSLKLRHLSAWLPPRGYNSVGATLDGVMLAWAAVVYAYGADKSDMMRSPSPSLRKLGE